MVIDLDEDIGDSGNGSIGVERSDLGDELKSGKDGLSRTGDDWKGGLESPGGLTAGNGGGASSG